MLNKNDSEDLTIPKLTLGTAVQIFLSFYRAEDVFICSHIHSIQEMSLKTERLVHCSVRKLLHFIMSNELVSIAIFLLSSSIPVSNGDNEFRR